MYAVDTSVPAYIVSEIIADSHSLSKYIGFNDCT